MQRQQELIVRLREKVLRDIEISERRINGMPPKVKKEKLPKPIKQGESKRLAVLRNVVVAFDPDPLGMGRRVSHASFGFGIVADVGPRGLTIDFEGVGQKRIMPSFVQPAPL
ncbi:hypothetical protein [Ferrovibrio sp.]|uniref:hypothetical protein n=1 Tax=Ferrovibrio sp. TaxID=1917215 RepID=UPI0025C433F2|nr:hypothetical protein [Ferrovibrio sp.]